MFYRDSTRVRGVPAGKSCRGARVYNVLETDISIFSPYETLGESGFMTGSVGLCGGGGGQCAEGSSVTSHTTRVKISAGCPTNGNNRESVDFFIFLFLFFFSKPFNYFGVRFLYATMILGYDREKNPDHLIVAWIDVRATTTQLTIGFPGCVILFE